MNATALFSDGDLTPAEQIVRAYLLKHGDHIEAMRLLACRDAKQLCQSHQMEIL